MAPSKRKTAFQFFQAENIGLIKNELGAGASMGSAMTEVSIPFDRLQILFSFFVCYRMYPCCRSKISFRGIKIVSKEVRRSSSGQLLRPKHLLELFYFSFPFFSLNLF